MLYASQTLQPSLLCSSLGSGGEGESGTFRLLSDYAAKNSELRVAPAPVWVWSRRQRVVSGQPGSRGPWVACWGGAGCACSPVLPPVTLQGLLLQTIAEKKASPAEMAALHPGCQADVAMVIVGGWVGKW